MDLMTRAYIKAYTTGLLRRKAKTAREGLPECRLCPRKGGVDRVRTLKLLEGIVDIYMPDFKFWDPAVAAMTCQAPDYPEVCCKALKEMHGQVGDLRIDDDGIARHGLLLRHLVMPGGLAGTRDSMHFIATQISVDTYINIMDQYRPCGRAVEINALNRRTSRSESKQAVRQATEKGLFRLD